MAALWGKEEAVRLLLEEGADPAMCDEDELLPVDYARSEGTKAIPGVLAKQ